MEVLKGIDVKIKPGETIVVMGASGAGKSTLLHLLGSLEPVTSGKIFYKGKNLTDLSSEKLASFRNKEIGFVFQFHYLLQEFTALENVLMPALIAGENRQAYSEKAKLILEEVGLGHRLLHRPAELSGGEQQRVALARSMIMGPQILLADEPTGNLDSENSDMVRDLLLHLNKTRGLTVLLVTHDGNLGKHFSRQITMRDGRIASDSAT